MPQYLNVNNLGLAAIIHINPGGLVTAQASPKSQGMKMWGSALR